MRLLTLHRSVSLGYPHSPMMRVREGRSGVTRTEVIITLLLVLFGITLSAPALVKWRETARTTTCRQRLGQLALAMQQYHEVFYHYPAAADWDVNATQSLSLHSSRRIDRITYANWAQKLLPYIGQAEIAQLFDSTVSVGHENNAHARTTRLSAMVCPSDHLNQSENNYEFRHSSRQFDSIQFARGNYAINGGTQSLPLKAPSTSFPNGDYTRLRMQMSPREYQLWGNGIAGINKSFSQNDIANGQSYFIALEEVRAGVHALDPRGVWALGQIGGSITWAHGVGSDAFGPNNSWERSDDIMGCAELHEIVGSDTLSSTGMPCVHYVDENRQATSRSQHPGGVHVAFLDGSVRFIGNQIDTGIWHVLHSRKTPVDIFSEDIDSLITITEFDSEKEKAISPSQLVTSGVATNEFPESFMNDIGMQFQYLSAGTFEMGMPDRGNFKVSSKAYPVHVVTLSHGFYLGRYEVTQGQYFTVMEQLPAAANQNQQLVEELKEHPVVDVTCFEAEEFCKRLSAIEKQFGRHYRLPTEAEWEYACRAGDSKPYLWRSSRTVEDDTGECGGIFPALPLQKTGSFAANDFGIYDLQGNAWEWTADWFDRDYYARSPSVDPRGPHKGFIKVVRGNRWRYVGEKCHIDYPMMPPWSSNPFVGFRVVCELIESPDNQFAATTAR